MAFPNALCVTTGNDTDYPPGDGSSSGGSVLLTAGILRAIREWFDTRGVSAQRQIERYNRDELIADFDEANGPTAPGRLPPRRPGCPVALHPMPARPPERRACCPI
ncbi:MULTISPECIES: hypothetical protein [Streptomyces]|uniref:Uncharacterized protein n=1 Tax=Streptomyces nymphaeiformis TaxID=2663842 RepID=A0A7W7TWL3_9ACTN|nr:hypothetical protein [Streptomyces nymphaeiformis]MBB4980411.1 hypothetical protein [Streptomyces nymphaeiformis]